MTNKEIYDFIIDYQKQQKIEQKQRELANAEYTRMKIFKSLQLKI